METLLVLTIIFLPMLIGIFVIAPFVEARKLLPRSEQAGIIIGSIFWPFGIFFVVVYCCFFKPGVLLYNKSVDFFTPKPILPTKINESKSSFRNISYEKEDSSTKLPAKIIEEERYFGPGCGWRK